MWSRPLFSLPKPADGIVEERRRLRKNHVARPTMAAAPTIPPTAPPAVALMFKLVELGVIDGPVDVVEEIYTVIKEAGKVVE